MRFKGLMESLTNSSMFKEFIYDLSCNKYPAAIYGLSESARAYVINGVFEKTNSNIFIIANSDVEGRNIYEDLSLYIPNVYYFPSKEIVFYNIYAISGDLRWERLKVIKEMLTPGRKVIVTTAEALAPVYTPFELYKKYDFKISVGDTINLQELAYKLVQCGYERMEIVDGKGQFSIRGGIIDLFSPISNVPYRIELFGDEVDSIRSFNTESQRSIDKVEYIEVFPAKEILLDKESIEKGYKKIEEDLTDMLSRFKKSKEKEAYDKINDITKRNLESLKENWTFETIDSFLPYFYDKTSTLYDYMGEAIIIVDDVQRCKGKLDSIYFEFEDAYTSFLQRGEILPLQGKLLVDKEKVISKLQNSKVIELNSMAKSQDILLPRTTLHLSEITLHNYQGKLDLLIEDIKNKKSKGYKTVILSGTRPRGERLVNTLKEQGIESVYRDVVGEIKEGEVVVTFGNQLKGYEFPELKLCIISDKEVFGEAKKKTRKSAALKKGVSKIKSFTDLKPGDYVVHTNHGIGIYKGIKHLEVQGLKRDFLELCYEGDDKLYVPVDQLDMVQKYIGSDGKAAKINKLGGNEWAKAKAKVKKSINEIAEDLVKLYASRSIVKGHKFSKDTVWQKQFEDEFPYEETPDQITSLQEIKADMESDKPMDRLLCGDVGYGKTEVALRAAFKAVMDGKQVAFLVPTTILAEQHYNNMIKRFAGFPVRIDMISRFRTPSQVKETLKNVKAGVVDILVGTHRILQKDVEFKDIGLLIIDEEQRFGVKHKEQIKNFKKNIDVITLTATPIPRTLHMSLTGVRDISVIETPPEERYPIQTYVVEYNEQLIRDAILRELGRDGQVFFVYNRVEDIGSMAKSIGELVPEARIAVAHGQMTERELEKVMMEFMNHEYDILVATTIIETGIDIQNVNTMIIYDADKMGLSQLYQLRGRVGRSNRIAYAYFTYRKDKILSEVAEKRLKAIKDFTELGSGFKIAMSDLEIRGAGNMMGSAQHGQMSVVGYDLYCRMLEETIKLIKGEITEEEIETTVELNIDAYIPTNYIEDEVQKIEVYKKIAAISGFDDFMDVKDELEDRFSEIPQPVYNLMDIAYLRSLGKKLGIVEIKEKGNEVYFYFKDKDKLKDVMIRALMEKYSKKIVFKLGDRPAVAYKIQDVKKEDLLGIFKEMLHYLLQLDEGKENIN
ncbi:MAG: transcription-repair coupling factor [Clostridiales bacterium]|uniref:transcription-repair coupling factor n=1 Tax=Clostridium sp. N3C TaxID=1776758 RepID=UPI00092E115D|nr:transcription-repair coupling factor [Clostridium sp. N3C]NLZ48351.1 transcription-repair coupling factor [Clostridiales bacterium]SCN23118.1 Transcription-repair-coupling factor [Clostridium sp. N3C]